MDTFLPVVATASVFSAILAIDVIRKLYDYLPVHIVLAVLSVAIMSYIANNVSVAAAWALLLTPFLFVFIGLFIEMYSSPRPRSPAPSQYVTAPTKPPAPASCTPPVSCIPPASCGGPASTCLNPATVKSA